MDDHDIRPIIESLDRNIEDNSGDDKARCRFFTGSPENLVFLTANRQGLLRLARTLLQSAIDPILVDDCRSKPVEVEANLCQASEEPSDRRLAFVQRMETWPEPKEAAEGRKRRRWWRDKVALLGCGLAWFILFFVLAAGVIAIWKQIVD